MTSTSTKTLS